MTEQRTSGRCLCGAVTYDYDGPRRWSAYCHCESCRRNCSAPVTAFFGVERGAFRWTGAQPAVFEGRRGVRRLFCGRCGSPMAYDADHDARNIHLYAASLDQPADYAPTLHVFAAERLPWFDVAVRIAGTSRGSPSRLSSAVPITSSLIDPSWKRLKTCLAPGTVSLASESFARRATRRRGRSATSL